MDTSGRARWHRRLHIVCAAAALLAAGCTTPNLQYLPADPSYARERHPVSVDNYFGWFANAFFPGYKFIPFLFKLLAGN